MPPVLEEDEDAVAVRRVLAGDLDAFEGIVQRWKVRLVNLAWRYCRDRPSAEEMAHNAFLKAFGALKTFRAESPFQSWMLSIALNSYRSWMRDRPPVFVDTDLMRLVASSPDPLAGLQARERAEAVRRAVLTLPPRYRDPIVLFYFQDKDVSETARILEIPEGTLKARLSRARELLKRKTAQRFAAGTVAAPGAQPDED
jgi:RNA polymerase sigma-70 factor, ECF subfamily